MNREEYKELIKRDPSIAPFIQKMSGSWRNKPYYRATPRHALGPTPAVLKARITFGESAYSSFGQKGLREVNGKPMPCACKKVQDNIKGKRFAKATTRERRLQLSVLKADKLRRETDFKTAMKKLKEGLLAIAEVVETTK